MPILPIRNAILLSQDESKALKFSILYDPFVILFVMLLLIQLAFATTSIVLIFLSNVDVKVCFLLLVIYSYFFLIRNQQNKVNTSVWTFGIFIALVSLNAYKFNPKSDQHLRHTIQSTKSKNWSKARDDFSKMYTDCSHCLLKRQDYPESLKREALISSYNEKSNSYKSMMDVIYKFHKNIPEDQLSYVLLRKSANELNGLGDRINAQNERAALLKSLDFAQKNKTYTAKTKKQKRTIASNARMTNPKLIFKSSKNQSFNKRKPAKLSRQQSKTAAKHKTSNQLWSR